MYKTKKEIDAHVQDIFNKTTNEKEKNLRCFAVAKAYYGIREFHTAKRYLETYLASNPADPSDACKFMGDILSDMGDKERSLDSYKQSYESGKNRIVLNRICDLLHLGIGEHETAESKRKWFELHKSAATSTPVSSWTACTTNTISNDGFACSPLAISSPAIGAKSTPNHPPRSKIGFNLVNGTENGYTHISPKSKSNAQVQTGDNFNNSRINRLQVSPERADLQMRYMERHYDDVLSKLLEQNCKIFSQLTALTDEFKDYRETTERNFLEISRRNLSELNNTESEQSNTCTDSYGARHSTPNVSQNQPGSATLPPPPQPFPFYYPPAYPTYPPQMFLPQQMADPRSYFTNPYLANLTAMYANAANPLLIPQPPGGGFGLGLAGAAPVSATATQFQAVNNSVLASLLTGTTTGFGQNQQEEFKDQFDGTGQLGMATPVKEVVNPILTPQTQPSNSPSLSEPVVVQNLKPLSELFTKAAGSWECDVCYVNNEIGVTQCLACQTLKPGSMAPDPIQDPSEQPPKPAFMFGFPPRTNFSTENTTSAPSLLGNRPSIFGTPLRPDEQTTLTVTGFGELARQSATSDGFGSKFPTFTGFKTDGASFSGTSPTKLDSKAEQVVTTSADVTGSNDAGEDDFVPTAEFAPVIPLPPLVEVKKGDEDENVIHEVRGKLFRYDSSVKEWKERGIGIIKILQSKTNKQKVRIVMWREQVQKVACNHSIDEGMTFSNHLGNKKSLTWTAQDFSEGGQKLEIFVLKFAQEQQCEEFKNNLEKMILVVGNGPAKEVDSSVSTVSVVNTQGKTESIAQNTKPLFEMFKKPVGSWDCDVCYVNNSSTAVQCISCSTVKQGSGSVPSNSVPIVEPPKPAFTFSLPLNTNSAKESGTPSFSFGAPSIFAGNRPSIFGAPPKPKEQITSTVTRFGELDKQSVTLDGFGSKFPTFTGFKTDGTSIFANPPSKPDSKAEQVSTTSSHVPGSNDAGEDDFVPTAEFAPVIPLPPLVEVKKGDEDENVIHEVRGKLYRYDSKEKQWKERGIGIIKIFQSKTIKQKVRIVMWRDQVQKVACNHFVHEGMTVSTHLGNKKSLTWTAQDFSEGGEKLEIFVCRFAQEQQCEDFKNSLEKMIVIVNDASPSLSPKRVEEEEIQTTPVTSCSGCIGCEDENFDFSKLDERKLPTYQQQTMTPEEIVAHSKQINRTPPTPELDNKFKTPTTPAVSKPQLFTTETPTAPVKDTPNPTALPRTRREENKTSSPFPRVSLFPSSEVPEATPVKHENPFASISLAPTAPASKPEITKTQSPNKEFKNPFESSAILSATGFGDLAKEGQVASAFSGFSGGFKGFEGVGSPVFGGNVGASKKTMFQTKVSDQQGDGDEEFVPTAEFAPVIPLPPLIEVKKGDEEEGVVFEVRAKLFRFETNTKEWKEKGTGNIKILQHKSDSTKVRIVMWREQVQQVACNHGISKGMKVTHHMESQKALTWIALDHSGEKPSLEKFVCRFSNEKQCAEFKGHLQEMIDLVEHSTTVSISSPAAVGGVVTTNGNVSKDKETISQLSPDNHTEQVEQSHSDDDEEDDEDEEPPMYEGECHVYICNTGESDFTDLGVGTIRVIYDGDMYCSRFSFISADDEVVVDHYILAETTLESKVDQTYEWEALNETGEHQLIKCRLRTVFSNDRDFELFADRMADSIEMAAGAGVTEKHLLAEEH